MSRTILILFLITTASCCEDRTIPPYKVEDCGGLRLDGKYCCLLNPEDPDSKIRNNKCHLFTREEAFSITDMIIDNRVFLVDCGTEVTPFKWQPCAYSASNEDHCKLYQNTIFECCYTENEDLINDALKNTKLKIPKIDRKSVCLKWPYEVKSITNELTGITIEKPKDLHCLAKVYALSIWVFLMFLFFI